ncbi:glycosyltransferase family A protein [Aureibaculum conchae]|uniref:glycosyltransferase family A protein n=1 Tax=Aureibaculum sp. 2308TA14-22 TaxID=3108392 RepID=UPI00339749E5
MKKKELQLEKEELNKEKSINKTHTSILSSRKENLSTKNKDEMEQTFFTIFTPIYNRKRLIHRVWESLLAQTNQNFEWIVIDNGSNDGIEELLEEYQSKATFPMKVIYQKDSGKYLALNRVVHIAKGELLFPADSDDTFEPNLIERMTEVWAKYKAEDISGITGLCKYENGEVVGDEFPFKEGVSTIEEIFYKQRIGGEKWGCIRVDVLKKYPYPTNFGVRYFPDQYIWDQIGFNYKTVFVNEVFRTYFQDAGDQITKQKYHSKEEMRMKNFYTLFQINYQFSRVGKYLPMKEYLGKFGYLWLTTFRSGTSIFEVFKKLESPKSKIVAFFTLLPTYLVHVFNLGSMFHRKLDL